LVVLLLEYLESAVVRDRREAEAAAGVAVLATVPPGGRRATSSGAAGSSTAARPGAPGLLRRSVGDLLTATGKLVGLGWPVLLMATVGAVAAFALSSAQPTVYRARTRVAVEPARGSDWGQTQAIRETMRGFSEDIRTQRMATEVNNRAQLDLPPGELLEKLNVAPNEAFYEIWIDVRDRDPDVAEEISRSWAQLFVEERIQANQLLDQRDRILTTIRDHTTVEVWSPKPIPNGLAGAVLGALVGAGAVFLSHLVRRGVILSPADAGRAAEAPLLAAIPSSEGRRRTVRRNR
jgi:capsular polysaccharide biosynthesis protein